MDNNLTFNQTASQFVSFLNQQRTYLHQGKSYTISWDDSTNRLSVIDNSTHRQSFSATWNEETDSWLNTGTELSEEMVQYALQLEQDTSKYNSPPQNRHHKTVNTLVGYGSTPNPSPTVKNISQAHPELQLKLKP